MKVDEAFPATKEETAAEVRARDLKIVDQALSTLGTKRRCCKRLLRYVRAKIVEGHRHESTT